MFFDFAYADETLAQTGRASSRGQIVTLMTGPARETDASFPRIGAAPDDPNLARDGFGVTGHAATRSGSEIIMLDVEAAPGTSDLPAGFETYKEAVYRGARGGLEPAPRGQYVQVRPVAPGTRPPASGTRVDLGTLDTTTAAALRRLIAQPYRFHRLGDGLPEDAIRILGQETNGRPVFLCDGDHDFFYAVLFSFE